MPVLGSAARAGVWSRLWSTYVTALKERPVRTKMITGAVTTLAADLIAQLAIEGKTVLPRSADKEGDSAERDNSWNAVRTLRQTFYGGVLFAPLAHTWLEILHKVKFGNAATTLIARLCLDFSLWSPFVVFWFTTTMSLLEGKSLDQIRQKFELQFFPTWGRAVCVFGPAQVINLTLVPFHHRNFVLQSVGLTWNVYLSWVNNKNNRTLQTIAAPVSTTAALDV
ncbi:hypothetical protein BD324DRAFT_93969 [Kockovaella imperatae]|uniref:Uncharacterized protein n=1 Tax=Kockovaella imperatae TaxID=4999 RepID=A0A1Y1UCV7_9TREE|nr:hypothetical protein BD324DRAFT_93969 [Kockovaella imperatae]ORX35377.1 hypothetical protein BD324DRAFT_93969 [Kockovaella imperatae]